MSIDCENSQFAVSVMDTCLISRSRVVEFNEMLLYLVLSLSLNTMPSVSERLNHPPPQVYRLVVTSISIDMRQYHFNFIKFQRNE